MDELEIAKAIREVFWHTDSVHDNVATGLDEIARAIMRLGNLDASTPYGAIEAHGMCVQQVAQAVDRLADAVGLIADAMALRTGGDGRDGDQ